LWWRWRPVFRLLWWLGSILRFLWRLRSVGWARLAGWPTRDYNRSRLNLQGKRHRNRTTGSWLRLRTGLRLGWGIVLGLRWGLWCSIFIIGSLWWGLWYPIFIINRCSIRRFIIVNSNRCKGRWSLGCVITIRSRHCHSHRTMFSVVPMCSMVAMSMSSSVSFLRKYLLS
jgi:hypothetical protein